MFQSDLLVNNSLHDYCLAILQVTPIRRGVRSQTDAIFFDR